MSIDENNTNTDEATRTKWHNIFAAVLREWLEPVNIVVSPEEPLTAEPQRIDILLLKHNEGPLTPEQFCRLADGLRDSQAQHLLLEFKYTESFCKDYIKQTMGYETTYRTRKKMTEVQVDSFLLCSQSPRPETLRNFGYTLTEHAGVYRNDNPVLADTLILSLNDLSNEPHNIPLKIFASKMQEKRNAFEAIDNDALHGMSLELEYTLEGLQEILFDEGEKYMANIEKLTPEYVKELGRKKIEHILSVMPADEVLKRYAAEERLKDMDGKEIMKGLSKEQLQQFLDELNKK